MLKKFFTSMLGTIAGIFVSIIAFFAIIFLFFVIIVSGGNTSIPNLSNDCVLYLDLSGEINERYQPGNYFDFIVTGSNVRNVALDEMLNAIPLAAKDEKIKGLYIDCGGSSMGFASRQELMEALQEFKKSGKFIYAYADGYSQGDYYLASIADNIYLNPVGDVDVRGLATSTMFYKNLLDKVGVEMQVLKVGTFKSAVEPFIRTEMSDSSRMQNEVFLNNIWADLSKTMANNRSVTNDDIQMWADSMIVTWAPEQCLSAKAVTALNYRKEVEDKIRTKLNITDKEKPLPLITPLDYLTLKRPFNRPSQDHIAVLYAVGDIVDDGNGGIVASTMVPMIDELAMDKHVKALVFRVNSGGGSAFASEQIWEAINRFKAENKPVYVSMGDYAASGGYYISCNADKIYADRATLTGSIGIFGILPCAKKLMNEHLGLNVENVTTNPNAAFPQIYSPMTDEQREKMQAQIERGYDTFTSRVAAGRGMTQEQVKRIGEGRVWDGQTALTLGLVDQIGSLNTVIADMAEHVNLTPKDIVQYPQVEQDIFEILLSQSQVRVDVQGLDALQSQQIREYVKTMNMVNSLSPVQARMMNIKIQ